jgi:hypothetical protein
MQAAFWMAASTDDHMLTLMGVVRLGAIFARSVLLRNENALSGFGSFTTVASRYAGEF